jgi:hypothetical protein
VALPSAPAQPGVVLNGTIATVSWVAPPNGGTAIDLWFIDAYLNGAQAFSLSLNAGAVGSNLDPTPGANDSWAIAGLTPGTWTFTVAATNDGFFPGGVSPQSPAVTVVATTFTVGYLIDRTFDLLLQAAREERNQLGAAIGATDTVLSCNYALGQLREGTFVAIDDEVCYVWASSPGSGSSSTITVSRGERGTTPAAHAAGATMFVNPYFTRNSVRLALQDDIRSWGPQVFQVKTLQVSATEFVRGYDMGNLGPWFYVLDIEESPNDTDGVLSDNLWRSLSYRIGRSANVAAFPSGNALFITDPLGSFDVPRTYQIVYAAPIDVDTSFQDGDSLLAMGMDSSDLDIAPYGAAWRLASGREVRRMLTEAQGVNADLQNFPAGYQIKAAMEFKMLRDSRLSDAISRLRAQYPVRRVA